MTDYFSLLEIDRRPWLDPEQLKEQFQRLSAAVHPDRFHQNPPQERDHAQRQYTELNAAHQCLREPKDRLRHLLELERGAKPLEVQQVPAETMETGLAVGQLCAKADRILEERRKRAGSQLLQVSHFEREQEMIDQLRELQSELGRQLEPLLHELKDLNRSWVAAPTIPSARRGILPLDRLEQIYRLLSYLDRWDRQLRERIVELSL